VSFGPPQVSDATSASGNSGISKSSNSLASVLNDDKPLFGSDSSSSDSDNSDDDDKSAMSASDAGTEGADSVAAAARATACAAARAAVRTAARADALSLSPTEASSKSAAADPESTDEEEEEAESEMPSCEKGSGEVYLVNAVCKVRADVDVKSKVLGPLLVGSRIEVFKV